MKVLPCCRDQSGPVAILVVVLRELLREEKGVTAIEYALIAGVMCTAIVGAVTLIGTRVSGYFNPVAADF